MIDSVTVPRSAARGEKINVVVTVKNNGDTDAETFNTGYYLSLNQTISRSDTRINGCKHISGVSAGMTSTCNFDVTIPSGTSTGIYYFGAIADEENAISESNELNNTGRASHALSIRTNSDSESGGKPDLVVTSVDISPGTVVRDGKVYMQTSAVVKNNSAIDITQAFRESHYLSRDKKISTDDVLIHSCLHRFGIKAGEEQTLCNGTAVVNSSYFINPVYIGVLVDSGHGVIESDEDNNTGFSDETQSLDKF